MHLIPSILQTILVAGVLSVPPANAELEALSLSQLEQQLAKIDSELGQLASFTLRPFDSPRVRKQTQNLATATHHHEDEASQASQQRIGSGLRDDGHSGY